MMLVEDAEAAPSPSRCSLMPPLAEVTMAGQVMTLLLSVPPPVAETKVTLREVSVTTTLVPPTGRRSRTVSA